MKELKRSSHLDPRSKHLRHLAINALEGGGRGHVGSTFSLIEIFRVLYDEVARFDPAEPHAPTRDRVLLSKGHGCIALYTVLADKGYFPLEILNTFCRFDSTLGGHPERGHVPGVEASTGSLGHGLSLAVGMAVAAKIRSQLHHVFVVVGDGELDEGSVWEAALAASHHGLDNLTMIVDFNGLQSYGPIHEIWGLEPLVDKFRSFGFSVSDVDGHDMEALMESLQLPNLTRGPRAVIARTIKGKGIWFAENEPSWHHKSRLTQGDIAQLREAVENA